MNMRMLYKYLTEKYLYQQIMSYRWKSQQIGVITKNNYLPIVDFANKSRLERRKLFDEILMPKQKKSGVWKAV